MRYYVHYTVVPDGVHCVAGPYEGDDEALAARRTIAGWSYARDVFVDTCLVRPSPARSTPS